MKTRTMNRALHLHACMALALAAMAPAAVAQLGNPAGMTPSSDRPAPAAVPNNADRLFVQLVGQGGLAEVDTAKLAASKAGHADVKAFAQQLIDDHAKSNAKLAQAARQSGLAVPAQPSPEQQAARARLAALSGAAFEDAYLQQQLVEHQKTAQLLQWHMGAGQQAPLQQVAMESLPTVLDHLAHVQAMLAEHRRR